MPPIRQSRRNDGNPRTARPSRKWVIGLVAGGTLLVAPASVLSVSAASVNEGSTVTAAPTATLIGIGEKVGVALRADAADDLYAASVEIGFDPTKVAFDAGSVASSFDGLYSASVKQAGNSGTVTFSVTRLGTSDGKAGGVDLGTVGFTSLAAGDPALVVKTVRLVDGASAAMVTQPGTAVGVQVKAPEEPPKPETGKIVKLAPNIKLDFTPAGTVSVAVYVRNDDSRAVDIRVTTPFGEQKWSKIEPGKAVYKWIDTKLTSIPAGKVTAAGYYYTTVGNYQVHTVEYAAKASPAAAVRAEAAPAPETLVASPDVVVGNGTAAQAPRDIPTAPAPVTAAPVVSPEVSLPAYAFAPGAKTELTVANLPADTTFDIAFVSTETSIGQVSTDSAGRGQTSLQFPADGPEGEQELMITDANGAVASVPVLIDGSSAAVAVAPAGSTGVDDEQLTTKAFAEAAPLDADEAVLARPGMSWLWIAAGALAILAIAAVLVARRVMAVRGAGND